MTARTFRPTMSARPRCLTTSTALHDTPGSAEAPSFRRENVDNSNTGRNPAPWDDLASRLHPEDPHAAQLYRDWRANEADGNAYGTRWAKARYDRWVEGGPEEPLPALVEPFEDTLARISALAFQGGDAALADLASQAHAAHSEHLDRVDPVPPFVGARFRQVRSASGWYVAFRRGPGTPGGEVYVCEDCTPKPYDGPVARANHIFAMEPDHVFDGITCIKCKAQGQEDRR